MRDAPGSPSTRADGLPEVEADSEKEPWVRCARCQERVARVAARIVVNGKHEHEFMNPAGIRYLVMCYAAAPGCSPEGEKSSVWTWFPGWAWQIEVCRACAFHLGWSFHGAPHNRATFHGLIRDHVTQPDGS